MNSLFGVSMTSIMFVLLAVLAVALACVGYVIVRNRIMFMIGLRNIPRRPAQTVLIIIGLMLSTLIISAAFTTGDTVDHSLTATSYKLLAHTDELVRRQGEADDGPRQIDSTIPGSDVAKLKTAIAQLPGVDGVLPIMWQEVPVVNPRSRQSEPSVNIAGLDATALKGFPDVISKKTGKTLDVGTLAAGEAYIDASAQDKLDAKIGDTFQVYVNGQPNDIKVVDIVKDNILGGVGDFNATEGIVTRLDTLRVILGRPDEVNFIAVSNDGGIHSGLALSNQVTAELKKSPVLASTQTDPYAVKRDLVDSSEEAGNFMATFFVIFGLFSIASGMLLIVMIFVMLAAERKSELGMARAVGTKRGHLIQMFLSEGMAYNMLAAFVGAALGVGVAFGMARIMAHIFAQYNFDIQPYVTYRSLIISYSIGVVLTFATVMFSSWRVSNLNIVRAIRDIPEPTGRRMGWRWFAAAVLGLAFGVLMVYLGLQSNKAFPFALGFSVVAASIAVLLRFLNFPERPVLSTAGVLLLVTWGLVAGDRLRGLLGPLNGGPEMFFLSGVAMVAAATYVLIYNADILLIGVSRVGGLFGSILPAIKTAVAYPLASKFRTGMTLAMISLVIFALTMMSTMNLNFDKLFLADSARGGWDVVADENPSNPIPDLPAALREGGSSAPDGFRAVGTLALAAESKAGEVRETGTSTGRYPVFGVDNGFVDGSTIKLSARDASFDSDAAVWQALKTRDDVAIVDRFTITGGGLFNDQTLHLSGIKSSAKTFEGERLVVQNPVSGAEREVQVIGVITFASSGSFYGVYVAQPAFTSIFGRPILSRHYVGLKRSGEAKQVARNIEATLLPTGIQADSLKQQVDDQQALSRNFFLLMQGFVGLGLFVGIAAVGVIAFRTVVERRQQIGMLRAIGYKRSTIALSFLLESSFITLLAIASGIGLAIWLSYFLLTSSQFPSGGGGYQIPWFRIGFISGLAFLASLVMTYVPSRQAASIPTAEALRYE